MKDAQIDIVCSDEMRNWYSVWLRIWICDQNAHKTSSENTGFKPGWFTLRDHACIARPISLHPYQLPRISETTTRSQTNPPYPMLLKL
jgi:hypothetical protein